MRMADERMPKRMLFGKLQTTRMQGGAKQRWKDCVQQDLHFMGLDGGWSDLAHQRDKWHSTTRAGVRKWEEEKNAKEQKEYQQKKAGVGVKCPRCGQVLKNEKGLRSHMGQKHQYEDSESSEDEKKMEKEKQEEEEEEDDEEEEEERKKRKKRKKKKIVKNQQEAARPVREQAAT